MVKLILLRHAITDENINLRLSGSIDSSISESGLYQIEKLNTFFHSINIDKIYTTTSSRTKNTVLEIAKSKNISIIEKETLKEIDFGDFEGMTFDEIKSQHLDDFNKIISEGFHYKYPNGESLIGTYDRVKKEINNIVNENQNKTILVCSHGGTIRNIITYLISNTYKYHWNFRVDNASVSILEINDGFTVINSLNNTSFL